MSGGTRIAVDRPCGEHPAITVAPLRGEAHSAIATRAMAAIFALSTMVPLALHALPTPILVATPSSPRLIGGTMTDSAMLSGATNPTGTLTFTLFGAAGCASSPLATSLIPVNGNGSYTSEAFGPLATGDYFWQVSYSGDSNNSPAGVTCGYGSQDLAVPQYCPTSPSCGVVASGCPGGLTIGNDTFVNTTTSCVGSSPSTTVSTLPYVGPNDLCVGPNRTVPCHVGAGDFLFATNTETVTANAVAVPTLSLWGLGILATLLVAFALRGLATRA
jgi:hypothetical protein